jgi:beta-glucosidase
MIKPRVASLFLPFVASVCVAVAQQAPTPQQVDSKLFDSSLPVEERVHDLVSHMTLEEKVSQMQDKAAAIPRLGVPEYHWWNEGLHGSARSGYSTVFPQAMGMAATWDTRLIHDVANVIATEARAKNGEALRHDIHSIYYGLDIWSPNINIFRDPRWGRGQETYGEDPYLTSRIGVAFVRGLQGDDPTYYKTIATPKHFAVHSGPESTRHTVDVVPSAHDFEDTYLPAFRATITEGKADSTMCAYNSLYGEPACANTMLLQERLRKDWGFKGYVTSDCGAIADLPHGHKFSPDMEHAAAVAVKAGTDTSCGAEFAQLTKAVKDGLIAESDLDQAVTRLFTARVKLGLFDPIAKVKYAQIPYSELDSAEHRALALRTAEEAMVLLKNDGVLPLKKSVKTIAVIGPNAASLTAIEGNYNAIPVHPVLPINGMESHFAPAVKVLYAQGSPYVAEAGVPVPRTVLHPGNGDAREGLKAEYFANTNFSGAPAATRIDQQINFDWNSAAPVPGVGPKDFGVRWTGVLAVPAPGDYSFGFTVERCSTCSHGEPVTVWVDGKEVEDSASKDRTKRESELFQVHFADSAPHDLRVEYVHGDKPADAGITLNWRPNMEAERDEAVKIAKQSDVVVAFVGLSPGLEGEEMPVHIAGFDGGDRTSIDLPVAQQQLLEAVAATGKPLVVVLMNGSALAVNWAKDHAAAVLETWYPGEEAGTAIARTLAGENNPAGRLPVTFYASTSQLPPFDDYSMKGRTYRYMDSKPLFGFGYGLSYTNFTYSNLKLSSTSVTAGATLQVEADVKNTGTMEGDEVAELYLMPPADGIAPKLALEGFQRVHLKPGATVHVGFTLDPRQLSVVDAKGVRAMRAGRYEVTVGGVQPSEGQHMSARFTITGVQELPR